MTLLASDPQHTGLHSHEIEALSRLYGDKVWQSYLENRHPPAARKKRSKGFLFEASIA